MSEQESTESNLNQESDEQRQMTDPENRFDRDTAVQRLADGSFEACIDRGWWIVRGPNGGYIAALMSNALTQSVGDPERTPRSLTIHYLSAPTEGPARMTTQIEREGRSLSTLTIRMEQQGRLRALGLAAYSTPRQSTEFIHATMPEFPEPEQLEPASAHIPIHGRYEYRFIPDASPGVGSERAMTAAWIRPSEPRPLDYALLSAYADALPPAVFARITGDARGEFQGMPTVDLTIHFRCPPRGDEDFCLAVFRSSMARQGYIEEDGEIWSRDGRLLAQSRQLAVILGAS
ncbi:MAG: thioesterase family protein [bacterium]|nr:thioesterase family protein [bacterium]